jgi:hypothetical protein
MTLWIAPPRVRSRSGTLWSWLRACAAASAIVAACAASLLLLARPEWRQVAGSTGYFAVVIVLWYGWIFATLQHAGIGMAWLENSNFSVRRAAALGAAIGAAYWGLPTVVLFSAADATTSAGFAPSAFAQGMSFVAFGVVLPSSLVVGAFWGGLLGEPLSAMPRRKWHVRVMTGGDADRQAEIIRSVIAKYRRGGESVRFEVGGASVRIPVRTPESGEALVLDMSRAGLHQVEVVDRPA